jgi:branched-chain amino acid transport system substrate-binding protein
MRRAVCIIGLVGIVAAVMGFAGTSALAQDKIKIGVIYSVTGPGSVLGPKQAEAAKMAYEEANAAGGLTVNGKKVKIEVIEHDDQTQPGVAIRRVTELVRTGGVKIIQGGTFAHVSLALNEEAGKLGFFLMTTNGVPDSYFEKKTKAPYSMAILGDNGMVGRGSAGYVYEKMNIRRPVFFMPDYAYGKFAWGGAEDVLKTLKGIQYSVVWSPVGAADMTPFLIKCMESNPDAICFGQWGNDMITALKQAGEMGLKKKTKLFVNWIITLMAKGIPAEVLEDVECQTWWYHDLSGFKDPDVVKLAADFTKKYQAKFGAPPDPYVMMAYYGAVETMRAITLSNSDDPAKMYKALMDKPEFMTAKGPAKWRIDGRPSYKYNSWIVRGLPGDKRKSEWDFGKIIDVYEGDTFLPTVQSLGW